MTTVFADTSFYAAIINRRDALHEHAREIAGAFHARIVTTEFVLLETANFCLQSHHRPVVLALVTQLRATSNVEMIPAAPEWFQRGLDLFGDRLDKPWSLTDCVSFAVMEQRRITDALSADHNFEQAGFRALLR
jgi:predicted nucleic acid-binding protein